MPALKGNLPLDVLRWNLHKAAREFETTAETLKKRLASVDEEADADDCWSTSQIVKALFSSPAFERTREVKERADHWSLRNGALRGELLEKEALNRGLSTVFTTIAEIIRTAPVPAQTRTDVLETLGRIPIVVRDVAARQRRQIHLQPDAGPNGEEAGDEAENPPSQHKARRIKRARIES
jgi:phage terminase Nu1 subunit (DNA packaging protein)